MLNLKSQKPDLSHCFYMDECLLSEIFSRLSVRSVCLMRCVCKSWNNLISSSVFIAHYHHHAHRLKSYLLLKRERNAPSYYPDQGPSFDHITTFDSLPFHPFPFRTRQQHHNLIFLDVIRGVVCLTSLEDPSNSPSILWNPTLQKYVEIPNSPFPSDGSYNNHQYSPSLGFGFNTRADDFRIVRLWMPIQGLCRSNKPLPLVYEVFSPRDGVWRMVFPTSSIRPGKVISKASFFMNGTIHWIISANKAKKGVCRTTEYYRLLMFDCEHEEFTTRKLPQAFERRHYKFIKPTFFRWRGKLAVIVIVAALSSIDLWVLEEYGVARKWKNLHYSEGGSEYFRLVSEASLHLMHGKTHAVTYAEKQACDDGKVESCQHILAGDSRPPEDLAISKVKHQKIDGEFTISYTDGQNIYGVSAEQASEINRVGLSC